MSDKQNHNKKRWIHRGIVTVLVVVMLISGFSLVKDYLDNKRAQDEYRRLAELAQATTEAQTEPATQESQETESETETETTYVSPIDFEKLRGINPDIVAWITVPGTNIDYPIVQGTDNDKYLHTSFEGEESVAGTIYLDYESDTDLGGWNNILYGHHMKNGSMFKDVVKYKDEAFFKEHQEFYIYTPERTIRLKAVAAYYDKAKPIVRKTNFLNQESFDVFFKEMTAPCSYADIPTQQVSSLYTLVTCSYEVNDARTYLFAVDMDALEDTDHVGQ